MYDPSKDPHVLVNMIDRLNTSQFLEQAKPDQTFPDGFLAQLEKLTTTTSFYRHINRIGLCLSKLCSSCDSHVIVCQSDSTLSNVLSHCYDDQRARTNCELDAPYRTVVALVDAESLPAFTDFQIGRVGCVFFGVETFTIEGYLDWFAKEG
jgi:hypothetical protein